MTSLIHSLFSLQHIPILLAVIAAGISIYTDVKWRLIKNYITLPLILIGWIWSFIYGGAVGLVENVLVSCVMGILPCMVGKVGEGDIKLIMGVSACLRPFLSFLFLAFYFVVQLMVAVYVRLKIYRFNPVVAIKAMRSEVFMELGGVKDANEIAHGEKVTHIGAPVIFFALLFCLFKAATEGFI